MSTNILAVGNVAASSSAQVLADGSTLSVFLKVGGGGFIPTDAVVYIGLLDDTSAYTVIGTLSAAYPGARLTVAGSYVFTRPAGVVSVGVCKA